MGMTTSDQPPAVRSQTPLERARDLRSLIEQEADATEAAMTMSPRAVDALSEAGLFWISLPRALGGADASVVEAIEVIEEVSFADASIGWALMANVGAAMAAYTYLGDSAVDAMFGGRRPAIAAGMLGPAGKSVQVPGGYQGSGKFAFGSGIGHAEWVGAGMLVLEDGKPRMLPSGIPEAQVCFVPRSKVELLGGWDVTGLVGTGSFDYLVPDQFVPKDFAFERTTLEPVRGGFRLGLAGFGASGHASVVLGLMRRALYEVVEIASTMKRPGFTRVQAESDLFKHGFALQEANYQAARDYTLRAFRMAEDESARTGQVSAELRARLRQACTWLHHVASEVVRFCHLWAGSATVRKTAVLSRVSRDMAVATQHVIVDQASLVDNAGPLIAAWRHRPASAA